MKGSNIYIRIMNVLMIIIIVLWYNHTIQIYGIEAEKAQLEQDLKTEKAYSNQILEQVEAIVGEDAITPAENNSPYNDGTYTGEAQGYGGTVKVEVRIEAGEITDIKVLSAEKEDQAYYNMALGMIDDMLADQTPDVDTVSGATYTSTGIKNAVIQAMKQAVK